MRPTIKRDAPLRSSGGFFDPDRRIFSRDKLQHLGGGFAVGFVLAWLEPAARAVLDTAAVGFVFEVGQWDAARGTPYLGQVGYGFGLLDWAAVLLGGAAGAALRLAIGAL